MKNNKVVLAYSGGLDTSFCLKKLIDEGFDVHPILINTGGFTKSDLKLIKYNSKIIGLGKYLPDNIVSNADLEKIMDTTDAWIQERTGIRERRHIVLSLIHI